MRVAVALLLLSVSAFAGSRVLSSEPSSARPATVLSFDPAGSGWRAVRGSAVADPDMRHDNATSVRVEGNGTGDVSVQIAPVALTIGKHYELSGWVRTEALEVRDIGRSPIASGAALSMASMPFDMHSESVGGSTDWTQVRLRFVATKAHDSVQLSAGNGGTFSGKAWFAGIMLEGVSAEGDWPASEAVQRFGPAYRY